MNLSIYYLLAFVLFFVGIFGMLLKRELISLLICLQLLFMGASLLLVLVSLSSAGSGLEPQVMAVFIAWTSGLQMVLALMMVTNMFRRKSITQVDELLQKTFS